MKKVIILYLLFQLCYSVSNAQIKLMDYISPRAGATNPTHIDSLGKGGYMVMPTIADRDAIPNARRKFGMLVFVQSVDTLYKLNTPLLNNSAWVALSLSSAAQASDSLALKLNFRDTTAMLVNRLKISDSATMLSNRLKISDTATMLRNRLKISDTASMLSNRIGKDTISLSNRINTLGAATGSSLVDSVNNLRNKIRSDSTRLNTLI